MKTKHSISSKIIILLIIHILIVLTTYFMVSYIQNTIKNDAMFINKIGQIRGGIQKDAKTYLYSRMVDKNRIHDARMVGRFEEIVKLSKESFPSVLPLIKKIYEEWMNIEVLMHEGKEMQVNDIDAKVYKKSEKIWNFADNAAMKIQMISESKQKKIRYIYYLLFIELFFLIYAIYLIYRKVNKTLENKSTQLDTIFNVSPDITIVTSGESLIKANRKFFEFTGYETLEAFKRKYSCICDMFEKREGYLSPIVEDKRWNQYVIENPQKMHKALIIQEGIEHIFKITVTPFTIDEDEKYVVVIRDITELEKMATTDMLTQLDNRKKIEEFIAFCIENFKRTKKVFSIIILDIDYFKEVNDTYGHDVGDSVLKEFAAILKNHIRSIDKAGRWGGEEFMIVNCETDVSGAKILAEKLRKSIEAYNFTTIKNKTASFGIAEFNGDMDFRELYMRADKALYMAKENGRNRVEVCE